MRIVDEGTGTITDATRQVAGLNTALTDTQTKADESSGALDRSTASLGRTGSSAEMLATNLGGAATQSHTMSGAVDEVAGKTSGLGTAFENTRGSLFNLTGGMAGFLPLIAGFSVASAVTQLGEFGHQVEITKDLMGGTAQQASLWTGAAQDAGVSNRALAMTIKGLQNNIDSLNVSMSKNVDQQQALQLAANKVGIDQAKYNDAVSKYGDASTQAVAAQDELITAQDKYNQLLDSGSVTNNKFTAGLKDLGINLYDGNGKLKSTNDLLMEMADAYANANDQQKATQDLMGILGQRAYQILPLLEQGSAGIQGFMQNTAAAGKEFNQAQLDSAVTTEQNINKIQQDISGFMTSLAQDVTPMLTFVSQHINVFKDLALSIGGLYLLKGSWEFGAGLVKDLGQAAGLAKDLWGNIANVANKIPGINLPGAAGSASSAGSSIFGDALDETKGIRVWWPTPLPVTMLGGDLGEGGPTTAAAGGDVVGGGGSILGSAMSALGNVAPIAGDIGGGGVILGTVGASGNSVGGGSAWSYDQQNAIEQQTEAIKKSAKVSDDIAYLWAEYKEDAQHTISNLDANEQGWLSASGDTSKLNRGIADLMQHHDITTVQQLQGIENAWNKGVISSQNISAYVSDWEAVTKAQGAMNSTQQQQFNALFGDGVTSASQMTAMMKEVSDYSKTYGAATASDLQTIAVLSGFGVTDINQVHNFLSGAVPAANSAAFNLQALANMLGGSVTAAQSLRNAISADVGTISAAGVRKSGGPVGMQWGGLIGMARGGILPHAEYGLPASSTPVVVGEAGPEVFMPAGAGEIIPNHRLQTLGGSGGDSYVNIDLRGTQVFSPSDVDMLTQKIGNHLVRSVLPRAGVRITR